MGIIKRITELAKANINHIIDTATDPERMLNQLMAELREEKRKAQLQVVRCIADEKRLEQQVREHQEKLAQWQKRAEVAVLRDEDDLAREAISRRNEYATMVDELTRQWEEQHQTAEQLKDALEQLDRRYREADMRKQHLLNRYRASQTTKRAAETITKLSNVDHMEGFAKVAEKIQDTAALAAANRDMQSVSLEDQFARLESEGVVEHDLMQLKLQMGKTVPQLGAGNGAPVQNALPGGTENGAPAAAEAAAPQSTPAAPASPTPPAAPREEEDDSGGFR